MRITTLNDEEIMIPVGTVLDHKAFTGMEEKKEWNPFIKQCDYRYEYNDELIMADDFTAISKECCRCCKKKIDDYSETYYQRRFEYNSWNSYKLNKASNYCKECAIKTARKCINEGWKDYLEVEYEEHSMTIGEGYGQDVTIKHMADGSIIEDMTWSEIARRKIK